MIIGLDHVQLAMPPRREEEARAYYAGILGMREVEKPESLRSRGGLWLRAGAIEVHLGVEQDFRPARKAHPAFRIGSLDALAARLDHAGYAPRWDDMIAGRKRFFADDPFGNRIEFIAVE